MWLLHRLNVGWAYVLLYIAAYRCARRIKWFFLVHSMMRLKRKRCHLLRKCVRHVFWKCPSVVRITAVFYTRRGYSEVEDGKIYWEAPLGITVWTKDGPAVALAVEFWNDTLCIRQLQGTANTWIPADMREWPSLFVSACELFVKHSGFKCLRLYRADQSLFYHFPDVSKVPKEKVDATRVAIQGRMVRRYEGTAEKMGFEMKRRWGEWKSNE